jgi:hypothetical protein
MQCMQTIGQPTSPPDATKILSRCLGWRPRLTLVTRCAPGMVLKDSATSPRLTEKHCITPLQSPTATFWVFFSPGGRTWRAGKGWWWRVVVGGEMGAACMQPGEAAGASNATHHQCAGRGRSRLQQVHAVHLQLHGCNSCGLRLGF